MLNRPTLGFTTGRGPLRSNASGHVARTVYEAGKIQHPPFQIFRIRRVLVRPVRANVVAVPIPHCALVVARRGQVVPRNPLRRRLNRLRSKPRHLRGETGQQCRFIRRRIGAKIPAETEKKQDSRESNSSGPRARRFEHRGSVAQMPWWSYRARHSRGSHIDSHFQVTRNFLSR